MASKIRMPLVEVVELGLRMKAVHYDPATDFGHYDARRVRRELRRVVRRSRGRKYFPGFASWLIAVRYACRRYGVRA